MFTLVCVRAFRRRTVFVVRDDRTGAEVFRSHVRQEALDVQATFTAASKIAA